MTVLLGHFDGQHVILDGPVPRGMRANTPVKVVLEVPAAKRSGKVSLDATDDGSTALSLARSHHHKAIVSLLEKCEANARPKGRKRPKKSGLDKVSAKKPARSAPESKVTPADP